MKPAEILIPLGLAACADVYPDIQQGKFDTGEANSGEEVTESDFECEWPNVLTREGLLDAVYGKEDPYGIHASVCPEDVPYYECGVGVDNYAEWFTRKRDDLEASEWVTVVGVLTELSGLERTLAVMPGQHCFQIADEAQENSLLPFFPEESLIAEVWGGLESTSEGGPSIEFVRNAIAPAYFDREAGDEFLRENQAVDGGFYGGDYVAVNGVQYDGRKYDISVTQEVLACLGKVVVWGTYSPIEADDATWDLRGDSWCREMESLAEEDINK
jgi:hypothetical protein